jgi:16S rRNA C1402 (ribose-2'-O) methylase RsmI
LLRSLVSIEETFGEKHEVYVGMELTKFHEKHYRDEVKRLREKIEEEFEGRRVKGEISIVVSPYNELEGQHDVDE